MNDRDANVPEGADFLRAVLGITATCERSRDDYLASKSPEGSITTHEHLGTVLSLLDRASSCWWGCRKGDHVAEALVARANSYGLCAFKLARAGFYDEATSLARTIGEM